MSDFDPYLKWLGIRDPQRPPNHYRLLGLEEFESDEDVIAAASDRQMAHVRSFQNGPDADASQKLLGELALARRCLMSSDRRQAYDRELREKVNEESSIPAAVPPAVPPLADGTPPPAVAEPATAAIPSDAVDLEKAEAVKKIASKRTVPRKNTNVAWIVLGGLAIVGLLVAAGLAIMVLSGNPSDKVSDHEPDKTGDSDRKAKNTDKQPDGKSGKSDPTDKSKGKQAKKTDGNQADRSKSPWSVAPVYALSVPDEMIAESTENEKKIQPVYFALAIRDYEKAEQILNAILNKLAEAGADPTKLPEIQACLDTVNAEKRFWSRYDIALAGLKNGSELTVREKWAKVVDRDLEGNTIELESGNGARKEFSTRQVDVDRDFAIAVVTLKLRKDRSEPNFVQTFRRFDYVNHVDQIDVQFDLESVLAQLEKRGEKSPFGTGDDLEPKKGDGKDDSEKKSKDPDAKSSPDVKETPPEAIAEKIPVPSSAERATAMRSIKKAYEELYASREATADLDLARQLVTDTNSDDLNPASRYAMLEEARRLYLGLGRSSEMIEVLDLLNERFDIKYFDLAKQGLDTISRKVSTNEEQKQLVTAWTLLWQKALEQEDYTASLTLIAKASSALKRLGDQESLKNLQSVRSDVQEMKRLSLAANKAFEQLKTEPEDAAANLAVGRFLCFVKNDFSAGLSHLARGSDSELKKVAELELGELEKEKSEQALAVAEAWYELGSRRGYQARQMKLHAAKWFRDAESELDNLKSKEVERILEEIAELESVFDVSNISGFGRFRFLGDSKWRIVWRGFENWEEAEFTSDGKLTYYFDNEKKETSWKLTRGGIEISPPRQNMSLLLVPQNKKQMIAKRFLLRNRRWREQEQGTATALEKLDLGN